MQTRELGLMLNAFLAAALVMLAACTSPAEGENADPPAQPVAQRQAGRPIGVYVVDDYASPQAAIDAAVAGGGGTVEFGARTYEISDTLKVANQNVRLMGQGRATILKAMRTLNPLIQVGAEGAPLYPFSSNEINGVHVDLNNTDTVGIRWIRWGQIGTARDVHFSNPGPRSVGIDTASNKEVNELVFEGINWWWDTAAASEPRHRGTGVRINGNNCKLLNSTIIGAAVALDVGQANAISQFAASGCRFKDNGIGIRLGGGAQHGGFAANVSDSRFEKNAEWDIQAAGVDAENRWDGIFLRGLFFSDSAGIYLRNTRGVSLDTLVVKDFTSTTTGGRNVFAFDGSEGSAASNAQFYSRNVIASQGTKLAQLVDKRFVRASVEAGALGLEANAAAPADDGSMAQIFLDRTDRQLKVKLPDGTIELLTRENAAASAR